MSAVPPFLTALGVVLEVRGLWLIIKQAGGGREVQAAVTRLISTLRRRLGNPPQDADVRPATVEGRVSHVFDALIGTVDQLTPEQRFERIEQEQDEQRRAIKRVGDGIDALTAGLADIEARMVDEQAQTKAFTLKATAWIVAGAFLQVLAAIWLMVSV